MCVEKLDKPRTKPVKAWKMFYCPPRHSPPWLESPCYSGFYRTGRVFKSKHGPGFQAFVNREDAIACMSRWPLSECLCIRPVVLYGARKGVIRKMDLRVDGKPGWCAPRMKVLPVSNV